MPRILIVDDHPIVREGLVRVLSAAIADAHLETAARAAAAMEQMRESPWDLVLLDISLPDQDGTVLLRELRQSFPAVPVLVVSMHPAAQFAHHAMQAGAHAYVSKGSPPHEIIRAARASLAGEQYVPAGAQLPPGEVTTPLPHETLSAREYQVLCLMGRGRTVTEIAEELRLSVKTVSTYRARILEKMSMRTSAELVRYAVAHHLVSWQPA
ncbi:MAG: response regulator transcription factor [Acidobacteria bacterium]|nr:response regulator transcription factor [Acidobacteriota bacterium]